MIVSIVSILILAIIGAIAVFSVQNVTTIVVSLLSWRFETTLPVLVCVAVLLGVVVEQLVRKLVMRRSAKVE